MSMDHLARIRDTAQKVAAARTQWEELRETLRSDIITADRAHDGPGFNDIIRAATSQQAMSKQTVTDAINGGRLESEVISVLTAAGLRGQHGKGDEVLVTRRLGHVLINPVGDEGRWDDAASVAAEAEDARDAACRALAAAGFRCEPLKGGEFLRVARA
jgi:hypothetical protein